MRILGLNVTTPALIEHLFAVFKASRIEVYLAPDESLRFEIQKGNGILVLDYVELQGRFTELAVFNIRPELSTITPQRLSRQVAIDVFTREVQYAHRFT